MCYQGKLTARRATGSALNAYETCGQAATRLATVHRRPVDHSRSVATVPGDSTVQCGRTTTVPSNTTTRCHTTHECDMIR
jgi:hypothetical protein